MRLMANGMNALGWPFSNHAPARDYTARAQPVIGRLQTMALQERNWLLHATERQVIPDSAGNFRVNRGYRLRLLSFSFAKDLT